MFRKRLVVIGIDGCDFFMVHDNLQVLDGWRELIRDRGFKLDLLWTNVQNRWRPWRFDSAMLWTTIFTGVLPEEHGIHGFRRRDADGKFEGRYNRREDMRRGTFIWEENSGARVVAWQIPAFVPPISYNCTPPDTRKTKSGFVEDLAEWGHFVSSLQLKEFDVLIAAYSALDHFQHYHFSDHRAMISFYSELGRTLNAVIKDRDDVLIVSDHGFTDIDTAIEQRWTWANSKLKNGDVGHHAPWGICVSRGISPRPSQTTEVAPVIRDWISRNRCKGALETGETATHSI